MNQTLCLPILKAKDRGQQDFKSVRFSKEIIKCMQHNESEEYDLLFFRFYLFIFREGKERREGEKHQCVVASHTPPTGDMACNAGNVP